MDDTKDTLICIKGGGEAEYKEVTMCLIVSGIYRPIPEPMPYFIFPYVKKLYLGNKQVKEISKPVLEMNHNIKLDSFNNFTTKFDQIPVFSDTMQELSLVKNLLRAPPSWIWKQRQSKLKYLNLSGNNEVVSTFKKEENEDCFDYCLDIYRVLLVNCSLNKSDIVLYTLSGVKELFLGGGNNMTVYKGWNELDDFSLDGITSYGARIINLNYCPIYDINKSFTDYALVAYLDLGVNYITRLPEEFGYLTDLEICILSSNKLEILPESIINLKKLRILFLSNNKIEYLPYNLFSMPKLKCVDLYDNFVDILPNGHENMDEFDFAQNYASEPEQSEYTEKRNKLRNKHTSYGRINEKKIKPDESDREENLAQFWDELPNYYSSEEEFAEQLGFEYVTEEQCDVDNELGAEQTEDEFIIIG